MVISAVEAIDPTSATETGGAIENEAQAAGTVTATATDIMTGPATMAGTGTGTKTTGGTAHAPETEGTAGALGLPGATGVTIGAAAREMGPIDGGKMTEHRERDRDRDARTATESPRRSASPKRVFERNGDEFTQLPTRSKPSSTNTPTPTAPVSFKVKGRDGSHGPESRQQPTSTRENSEEQERHYEDEDRHQSRGRFDADPMDEDEEEVVVEDDGLDDMAAMMGFGGFGSTKGKKVLGNNVGAARKEKKTVYRQYMNRIGVNLEKKSKKGEVSQPGVRETEAPTAVKSGEQPKIDDKKIKKEKRKDGKRKREVADAPVDVKSLAETNVDRANGVEGGEPPKKKHKDAMAEDSKEPEVKNQEKKDKKDKKRKRHQVADEQVPTVKRGMEQAVAATTDETMKDGDKKEEKKEKKKKKKKENKKGSESEGRAPAGTAEAGPEDPTREEEKPGKEEKKKKKKHKRKDEDGDVKMLEAAAAGSTNEQARPGEEEEKADLEEAKTEKKEKKHKKDKKDKKEKLEKSKTAETSEGTPKQAAPAAAAAPGADLLERWNVQGLDGGAKRQDKFMRLLGGKKHGTAAPAAGGEAKEGSRKRFDIGQVSQELEKQFDAGIRMKFGGGGQRRGLGA
ncbi:2b0725d7-f148-464c-b5d4-52238acf0055 [Thermothielavioides terrestris]|uniref:2b0725d7-f148-464c-b5d4-52238acf0055 n=1 Tax=Thermothielavioides terrestris TaxID=2587410 RepID=A0A3S4AMY1_9PEZI|nr:2b0725d7-f148-464c-b5d4-52238acf0055 [Thermothielavioides terrestris]